MKKHLVTALLTTLCVATTTGYGAQYNKTAYGSTSVAYQNYGDNEIRDNNIQPVNLLDAFSQALVSDPTFQSQRAKLEANKENLPIARSVLFPQVFLQGQSEYIHADNRSGQGTSLGGAVSGQGIFSYVSNVYGLSVTQPIFSFADWASVAEAKASVKQATAQFGADYQNLIIRLATAYFQVLQANDNLYHTIAYRNAVRRQYDQNLQRYRVGLGTITDVYDSKAQLDLIISEEIADRTTLLNAEQNLRAITGHMYSSIAGLKANVPLISPQPKDAEKWVKTSIQQNLTVLAARYQAQVSKQNVRVQNAGHLPTLSAIAALDETDVGNSGFGSTDETDTSAGIQLTFPIFQGGLVTSETKQAEYTYQQNLSNMEYAIRTAVTDTRQDYNNVVAGIAQIKADQEAIVSNASSVASTEAAFKVGTRTIVDVLQAQQQLYQAQTNYATDLYNYLIDILNLKNDAGSLSPRDLAAINKFLTGSENLSNISLTVVSDAPSINSIKQQMNQPQMHMPTPTQQQLQSLPVFTPQPQSQWTTPVTTGGAAATTPSPTPTPATSGNSSATTNTQTYSTKGWTPAEKANQ